ncbi:MAG: hypothetical protein HYY43_01795 [Deltaproteobacteria bacterium]|nr:hypothetical protein [Deltaproteobacteria bacterium]
MMKKIIIFTMCAIFSSMSFAGEPPQIPPYFNYSGSLTDDGGNLLPDGTKNIRFKIVNSAGGTIFEETQDVEIIKGEISAIVGNGINPSTGAPSAGSDLGRYSFKAAGWIDYRRHARQRHNYKGTS